MKEIEIITYLLNILLVFIYYDLLDKNYGAYLNLRLLIKNFKRNNVIEK